MSTYPEGNTTLSGIDMTWLRMEEPSNLMMITGLLLFDKMLDIEHLKATLHERLLPFERFRQRVIFPKRRRARWENQLDLDLDDHLHREILPAPADKQALQQKVSQLMSKSLDFSKPLWDIHLISYTGGCALLVRVHHCITDGMAAIQVIISLTETAALAQDVSSSSKDALPLFMTGQSKSNPSSKLLQGARMVLGIPLSLLKVAFLPSDPKTIFQGQLGVQKRAAWSTPISLADIKALASAKGATINDILLTVATSALRRYMEQQQTGDIDIRALVPINLRTSNPLPKLGNLFGLVFIALPTGIATLDERLKVLKKRMNALKRSRQPVAIFASLYVLGFLPRMLQDLIVHFYTGKATAIITNVPGPRELLYLAGSPIRQIMFWVPQSASIGLGLSILSYNGEVVIGVATDAGLVPDPETIVSAFYEELKLMMA